MDSKFPDEHNIAASLRRLLHAIEASGRAVLPSSNLELLQSIVDAAARIFGAAAASISLVDHGNQELEFKVAYGVGRDDVVGMRIPLNKGIAGYVAMTGQPISISDVNRDPRFLQEFAKSTGYVPSSILAMPLIHGEQVIGVMEVLDKIDAPAFGMHDMELLGVFAQQAAIAINQSQQVDLLGEAFVHGIKRVLTSDTNSAELMKVLEDAVQDDPSKRRELLDLAIAFYEISGMGEAEQKLCMEILSAFSNFNRSRPRYY